MRVGGVWKCVFAVLGGLLAMACQPFPDVGGGGGPGGGACTMETCSGRGSCEVGDGGPSCWCYEGYAGDHCEACDTANGWGPDASGVGCVRNRCVPNPCTEPHKTVCVYADGVHTLCACDDGYIDYGDGLCHDPQLDRDPPGPDVPDDEYDVDPVDELPCAAADRACQGPFHLGCDGLDVAVTCRSRLEADGVAVGPGDVGVCDNDVLDAPACAPANTFYSRCFDTEGVVALETELLPLFRRAVRDGSVSSFSPGELALYIRYMDGRAKTNSPELFVGDGFGLDPYARGTTYYLGITTPLPQAGGAVEGGLHRRSDRCLSDDVLVESACGPASYAPAELYIDCSLPEYGGGRCVDGRCVPAEDPQPCAGIRPLLPGHNRTLDDPGRINLVLTGVGYAGDSTPSFAELIEHLAINTDFFATGGAMFEETVNYSDARVVLDPDQLAQLQSSGMANGEWVRVSGYHSRPYVLRKHYGMLGTTPLSSNRDRFNVWVLERHVPFPRHVRFAQPGMPCPGLCETRPLAACELPRAHNVTFCNLRCQPVVPASLEPPEAFIGFSEVEDICLRDPTNRYCRWRAELGESRAPSTVVVHELGHVLGGLADEYLIDNGISISRDPNCAQDLAQAEQWWGDLVRPGSVVGYYEGCFWDANAIRPTQHSIMRHTTTDRSFGPVNERHLCQVIDDLTGAAAGACDDLLAPTVPLRALDDLTLRDGIPRSHREVFGDLCHREDGEVVCTCGDGTCDADLGEHAQSCPQDC